MFAGEPLAIWERRFAIHDVGLILQSLLMFPGAFSLYVLGRHRYPRVNRWILAIGFASLMMIVVSLWLGLTKMIWNAWYMVPQAILGMWLIVISRTSPLSPGLTRLATIAGLGFVLVGTFPIGFAALVDPSVVHGPPNLLASNPPGTGRDNAIVHIVLQIGTLIGVPTYAIWSIFLGYRLQKVKGS